MTFSELCTAVSGDCRGAMASHEEIDAVHAPSECHGLTHNSFKRRVTKMLADGGYTIDEFLAELERRTSCRYVYFSEFGYLSNL